MDNVEFMRNNVALGREEISHPSSLDFPGNFPDEDLAWDFEKFQSNFKLKVVKLSKYEMEVDLIGLHSSVANAFRRILLSHLPSMAIETVFSFNNTSVMHDEILAHRLGLVPIFANPDDFDYREDQTDNLTDANTLVFKLHTKCVAEPTKWGSRDESGALLVEKLVLSKHLEFVPKGAQAERYTTETRPRPVHSDIVLCKLKPGQEINLEVHCHKGVGFDHAKFSPVATASYRLMPVIHTKKPITGRLAHEFKKCFAKGVVEVVTNDEGVEQAKVVNPRLDTVSREVLRHPELAELVVLSRVRDHFIFNIESVGVVPASVLFSKAIQHLIKLCTTVKAANENLRARETTAR